MVHDGKDMYVQGTFYPQELSALLGEGSGKTLDKNVALSWDWKDT